MAQLFSVTAAAIASVAAPAASLYYGKNGEQALKTSFAVGGLTTLLWGLFTYSEIFAPLLSGGIIGSSDYASINKAPLGNYWEVIFEFMYLLLTVNLVAGSVQHVIKPFWLTLIATLVGVGAYAPFANWMWNSNGWLGLPSLTPTGVTNAAAYGAIDYAGGIVVHVVAGVSALVLGVMSGKKEAAVSTPANFRYLSVLAVLLGCFFLNAASWTPGNDSLALLNTQMAAFAGVATYAVIEVTMAKEGKYFEGTATVDGAAKGAMIGLAIVASGAGIVAPMYMVLEVFIGTVLVYVAERLTTKWQSASMEVFLVHGFGGAAGAALTGLFSQGPLMIPTATLVAAGAESVILWPAGAFFSNGPQLGTQCAAISIAVLLSGVATFVITKFLIVAAKVTGQGSIFIEEEYQAVAKTESA